MLPLILLSILILTLYIYLTWTFDYWKKRGVPYEHPTIIFGIMNPFQKKNMVLAMRDLYMKHIKEDYFGVWLMRKPTLVINNLELIKRILVQDYNSFDSRVASSRIEDPFGYYNIFSCEEPLAGAIRKRLRPSFSVSNIKGHTSIMLNRAKALTKHIDNGRETSLSEYAGDYATDVICGSSFGIHQNCVEDTSCITRQITKKITSQDYKRRMEFMVSAFQPSLAKYLRTWFFSKEASEHFSKIYKEMLKIRSKNKNSEERRILLDSLKQCQSEILINGKEISDDIIIAQGILFMFAGTESTTLIGSVGLLEIAYAPHIQTRLYNELKEAVDKNDGVLDYEVIANAQYLEMVVKEILRKYPVIGALDRVANREYKLDDRLTIEKGTPVLIQISGLHFDPRYWEEPYKFIPERFSKENEKKIVPFTYLPFGEGHRKCTGYRYGMLNMKVLYSVLLMKYELKPHPKCESPDKLKFTANSVFINTEKDIYVQFVKRK